MKRNVIFVAAVTTIFVFLADQTVRAQAEDPPRFEVGAHFSSLTIQPPPFESFRTEPGVGGRFTVNVTDYLAAEAEATYFPNDNGVTGFYSGGRTTQGLFGVKAGKRFERFGVFGKVRPGFVSFSRVITGQTLTTLGPFPFVDSQFGRRTEFATDIGGVLEFYPTRRIVTRFDIGDTLVRYRTRTLNLTSFYQPTFDESSPATLGPVTFPGETKHNFQFTAGIGFRF